MEQPPPQPASCVEELPAYYQEFHDDDILTSFRNLDKQENFEFFDRQTRNPRSSNFCVDFGDDDAYCAFDLGAHSFSQLLSSPRPSNLNTRWINIWLPYNQKDTLHVLAKHCDFSPRLLNLMCADPLPSKDDHSRMKESSNTFGSKESHRSRKSKKSQRSNDTNLDSEESIGMTDLMHSTQLEMVREMSHYHIVDEVWHWSTVDWGRRCKYHRSRMIVYMLMKD